MKRIRLQLGPESVPATVEHVPKDRVEITGPGFQWQARPRDVFYDEIRRPHYDKQTVRCHACLQYKPRKGGTNINHKFICADCRPRK